MKNKVIQIIIQVYKNPGGRIMDKKKVKIDQSACIMCGACVGSYPDDFKFSDEGPAEAVTGEADPEAADICAVGAISFEE